MAAVEIELGFVDSELILYRCEALFVINQEFAMNAGSCGNVETYLLRGVHHEN